MKGYYQILAESLTDKYLTEAWSESMPNWMKPRLNATAMYSEAMELGRVGYYHKNRPKQDECRFYRRKYPQTTDQRRYY